MISLRYSKNWVDIIRRSRIGICLSLASNRCTEITVLVPNCFGHSLPNATLLSYRRILEFTNPRNRPLYERHGFKAVAEIKVENCPPIVPMLRRPKP